MANVCIICQSPNRLEIDKQILQNVSLAKISRTFEVSYNSLARHSRYCISRQLATAFGKKQQIESFSLLERIDTLLHKAETIFDRNFSKGHDSLALKALGEQRLVFDLLLRISVALHEIKRMEEEETVEEDIHAREEEVEASLKILSIEELEVMLLLSKKLETQNASIIVLPPKQLVPVKKEPKIKKALARNLTTTSFLRTKWHV